MNIDRDEAQPPVSPPAATDINHPARVLALEAEIARLNAKLQRQELSSKEAIADRESRLNQLIVRLVELEQYQNRCRELETRFRVTVAERDARILQLQNQLSLSAASTEDPETRRPRAVAPDRDDLQAIHGIGGHLEALLNSLGIRWYKQIAAWTPADVDFYRSKLDHFPGRISREDWVSHAKELHERKYGEKI
jgi:predicted flap endonuclease-1-like 5' DNA nuclease